MRVQLRRQLVGSKTWWRLTESDGELVDRWHPNEGPLEPLDRGGFEDFSDARGFALAIDGVRARAGLLGEMTVADIDSERTCLGARTRHRAPKALAYEAM
jgi:hypothetical protein